MRSASDGAPASAPSGRVVMVMFLDIVSGTPRSGGLGNNQTTLFRASAPYAIRACYVQRDVGPYFVDRNTRLLLECPSPIRTPVRRVRWRPLPSPFRTVPH